MKKLLLMTVLMVSAGEGLANTIYAYNGSPFDVTFVCYEGPRQLPGVGVGMLVVPSGKKGYLYDMSNSLTISCMAVESKSASEYSAFLEDGEIPDGVKVLTNLAQVSFDQGGQAAMAFYGQDQFGTNGTNSLRTCFGNDGAMC